jgi:hypothetical protein
MAIQGFDELIKKLQSQQDAANAANTQRLGQATAEYDKIIDIYKPGGGFGKGVEADLERRGKQTVAAGEQDLVSRGTFNTTARAALPGQFEENVAAPTRLSLEAMRQGKLAGARAGKAGLIERVEDTGPDTSLIASMTKQQTASQNKARDTRRVGGSLSSLINDTASSRALDRVFGQRKRR